MTCTIAKFPVPKLYSRTPKDRIPAHTVLATLCHPSGLPLAAGCGPESDRGEDSGVAHAWDAGGNRYRSSDGCARLGFDPVRNRSGADETRRRTCLCLYGFTDIARAVREVGGKTRVISVCDQEADCFELFDARRRSTRVNLLVRARHDRVPGAGQPKLFAAASGGAPDGQIDVEIDGLTARPKSSKKKAQPACRKRLAICELRFRRITLPATEIMEGAEPVTLSAVHIVETALLIYGGCDELWLDRLVREALGHG